MRDQLIDYVNLLFAGAPEAADIKDEILQNTLDRYDDLIAQGKAPQAAYRLAIAGIGDISEILGEPQSPEPHPRRQKKAEPQESSSRKKLLRAIAIALYILSPIPLFLLQNEFGLCIMLIFIAAATAVIVFSSNGRAAAQEKEADSHSPKKELRRGVRGIIWVLGLCLYFIVSFATGYWHITWLIFPLAAAVQGLVIACMDLMEAK